MKNRFKLDFAKGKDILDILRLRHLADKGKVKGMWTIDKWEFPEEIREEAEAMMRAGASADQVKAKYGDKYYIGKFDAGENLLLNEGINAMLTLLAGGAETAYSNANARLGVGDNNTAAAASQTALQAATNVLFKAMDVSFPTYGTSQQIVFRSTFGSAEGNYAWAEFSVDNGNSANKNFNRLVSAQGTKVSGQSWQVSLTITIT